MPSNALIITDHTDLSCCIPFNRSYYIFDQRSVDEGGHVVTSAKSCLKISPEQYCSFKDSASDAKWNDFLLPTNIITLKLQEGTYPYAFFEVAGFENIKYLAHPIPVEVAAKVLPKLLTLVEADPESYNLKLHGVDEGKARKNQARIDALRWTPADCMSSANKSKKMKPARPSPVTNGLPTTSVAMKKIFDECLRKLAPPKPSVAKRKAGGEKELAVSQIPNGIVFNRELLPGVEFDMAAPLNGGVAKMEVVGDRCFVRVFKRAKACGADAEEETAAAAAEEAEEAEAEEAA